MTIKPSELLRKGWTQGSYARTSQEFSCDFKEPEAVKWCLSGAIKACELHNTLALRIKLLEFIHKEGPMSSIPEYNDFPGRTQEECIALMERAERALEEEELAKGNE